VITLAVRWYVRYAASYRDVEELLAERGVEVDHTTLFRWVMRFTPLLAEAARCLRHTPGDRWFVDETHLKVAGKWRYLCRAIDQFGQVHRRADVAQAGQESGVAVLHPGAGWSHLADGGDRRSGTRLSAHTR
jgi:hypothetical protein